MPVRRFLFENLNQPVGQLADLALSTSPPPFFSGKYILAVSDGNRPEEIYDGTESSSFFLAFMMLGRSGNGAVETGWQVTRAGVLAFTTADPPSSSRLVSMPPSA
jgi:hypothetical protein